MKIDSAKFVISNTDIALCPEPTLPEFAFIGRSNVGKSSLINMLCDKKGLAKTSGKPGKTQLINHFLINENWYLVDLPGYGYAKVSKSKREKWDKFIKKYLLSRKNLMCVFVLIDSRIPPQEIDLKFMEYLGKKGVPFVNIFTKTDSVKTVKRAKNLSEFKKEMFKTWEELPLYFISSSKSKEGREEILEYIGRLKDLFEPKEITSRP